RGFEPNDALPTAAPVVIVDSVLAAREWPGERAVGKRVRLGTERSPLATVVGVIPHVIMRDVAEITQPQAVVPMPAGAGGTRWYAVHVNGDPAALIPAVRAAVRTLDPDLPLAQVASMEAVVKDRMFQPRVYGTMFALFAAIALLLAMIGLYGVMSYLVAQRTSELGIRMALGATARDVTRLVLGGAVRLLVVGLGLGIPAALGLAQLLRGVLYGVSATDPLTMLGIPLFLSLVALLASAIPARRAARVDPAIALRRE
ncbi:MAG: FtsX-like permease family protein, partial [Gemmatimonadaceae bacterium]|nr:FtsX-like permease family protein [Gemmatimonadaceae bacterium]